MVDNLSRTEAERKNPADGEIRPRLGKYSVPYPFGGRCETGTVLKIDEQHDWAQVFADGKLLGRLDRRRGEQELTLPELKKGTQLDFLVEAMGRVNFDKSIHDRKGITEKVELVNGENAETLKGWTVYNLPVDYEFVSSRNFQDNELVCRLWHREK